ncbi:DUF3618 domain-containing protein [Salinibacterium sp.]|uniref:DUF3618 domain-containing protein n=1 Tax=Salinibacterium sp. TaxID=1915057 RepID=UPI00286CA18F|nr:DUF3618 domain-containing protein [Salinibacterium sp.]
MSDVESRIAASRAELEATLDAIEDKLNVPKRMGELTERAKSSYESNPVPWIIGGLAAAVVVVGIVAWAILSNDD